MASAINRGAMIRIPLGNERSARIEVRSVAPDANPYMVFYTLLRTGLGGIASQDGQKTAHSSARILPGNIIDAIQLFQASKLTSMLYGEEVRDKFAELKQMAADRCPKQLGTLIKPAEVQFHHEVTNQWLWSMF
jgi:glutamine synthetase